MFFKDLTRVEQLEERERLRDRLAAVGEMAAVIAHEVKNPLAGIEVMAGLLRRKIADTPDAQAVLTDIINEAKMANAIVQEVLDFVRPIRLQVEHTAIADAVQGAIQLADTKARRGQVQVSVAIPDGLPQIQADQHQLTQVFTNLLMNAYEAMGGSGHVSITASRVRLEDGADPREAVLVQVADDGPGIAPDVAEKVFDPFFTTKPQGSGLGLAIVRKIVDAHDGRIDLRTAVGQGTTIRVTLPVSERRRGLEMGRILIADDHDSLRRGLAQAVAEAGHDVEEAPNGNAAIEKLHEGFFDVVVSDLKMGGSTGLEVLKTAKTLHPSSAIILMTAFGSVSTAVEAMKSGAFDYVQKPFEIEEMEVKIEKALEMRRMQNQIDYLRHAQGDIYDFDRIIGSSGALEKVLAVVRKVAKSNTTVLVRGETGTGKELIAGAVHHNSLRAARNFVKVNCAALQENLLESELFGHEKGAFTGADKQRIGRFEQADGGTLFLDEIGDMSANTQAKILRVLQEHEFERLGGTRTHQGGRSTDRGDQPRPADDGRSGPVPRGPRTIGSTS